LSTDEQQGLLKHFENGGMIVGDSICASAEFTESVHEEFSKLLPNSAWTELAPTHPIMLPDGPGGYDLRNVTLVDPESGSGGAKLNRREGPALIEALEWNGRVVMLFSPNDLSCAMESKHSMQCRGYVREDAFRIGIKMILFGMLR
jgi:hypothetical protein